MSTEIITRRHLPHWYVPGAAHFVTYRLAGSIPAAILVQLRAEREERTKVAPAPGLTKSQHREIVGKQFFAKFDHYLDTCKEIAWLAQPEVARVIQGNLYHHRGIKYHLLAYCVMPNHVHVLFQPLEMLQGQGEPVNAGDECPDADSPLSKIMHSLKSYTANKANALLGRKGAFWQHESYDHWVRDDDELARIIEYILSNPVKAGLVDLPHQWRFSSAHDRYACDGSDCGLLLDTTQLAP